MGRYRILEENGYVTTVKDHGVTYYMLSDQADSQICELFEKKLMRDHSPYARYADNPEFAHLQCPEIPKATI